MIAYAPKEPVAPDRREVAADAIAVRALLERIILAKGVRHAMAVGAEAVTAAVRAHPRRAFLEGVIP